ncbi:hypothetical protein [Palleronia caenipelagi]|uniref:DUF3892 domain-containing protein n=1 Tax=Palleronia caenipelagi TaxID=2489174 RepID=A0A547QAT0_9RHOB|nr:hypothetical protein [Palleronia caenipelagi]TRD23470.1 hypothetical protein FEV53_00185 [Palleronia caenipelagi]
MSKKKISVISESRTGLNQVFDVLGQGAVRRGELANQVERGRHQGYHVRRVNGHRVIASNPDGSTDNNLG